MRYIIGIDDHDSYNLGCTTHFSVILLSKLLKNHNAILLDMPYLVRLNPNIPWKTRGNASIRIEIEFNGTKKELADLIFSYSTKYVKEISFALERDRKPGLAIIEYNNYVRSLSKLNSFYLKGVSDVIPLDYAKRFAEKTDIEVRGDRGIIGSIAALGVYGAYTYELITYRKRENWLKKRIIDTESVKRFDEITFPMTFANYDYVKENPFIIPHGSDPILYGVRGTSIEDLLKALHEIKTNEDIDFFAIFKSNQGTSIHFHKTGEFFYQEIKKVIEVRSVEVGKGGDVLIRSTNNDILFVYKETGELNNAAKLLKAGDKILVLGAIKPSTKYEKIIELEQFEIIELNDIEYTNPKCPKCGSSTESLGRNKGFRCKKCRYIIKSSSKVIKRVSRDLSLGVYQTRIYRHLTKPLFLELRYTNKQFEDEIKFLDLFRAELYKINYVL
ncbi:tRNA(Ile)(2)-agmatinylcytidine synthase [Sulfolobus tengchongensis]|uniref:tRNA(Ile2) 2-agmatinylcytidine synthetase TiaS n=1 Tax=Sulfolobus tengchongensis TaxID=207809 RepID=A0AAX4KZS0_9CREN